MNERIVAFLDILGFKQLADDLQEKLLLNIISPLYFSEASNDAQKKIYKDTGLDKLHTTEVTFFSDSIVISCDIKEIAKLISHVKGLSSSFIEYGLFLRGGIAYGKLFHKNRIIFGPAMNEAYKLESEYAIHLRIIVSDGVYALIKSNTEPPVVAEEYEKLIGIHKTNEDLKTINNVFRDDDGFYFVNPFPLSVGLSHALRSLGITSLNDFIKYLKSTIDKKLQENIGNKKIFSKYFWLATKFNKHYINNNDIGTIEI